jgi:putative ABC transport system permease protein
MRPPDLIAFAGRALVGHRLRSVLTVVGLAVGIAAIVALTGLGEGARRYVTDQFQSMGSNLLIILPGKVETTGIVPFGGVVNDLTVDDVRAIRAELPAVTEAAPISMGTEAVRAGGLSRSVAVLGTSAELARVFGLDVAAGRFLSPGSLDEGGAEVVLGATVSRELFAGANPVGEVVRIGDWRFRVVGVLAERGRIMGLLDLDDLVLVPVHTGMSMFNRSSLFRVMVEVGEAREMGRCRRSVLALLARRHRAEDVTVISQDAVISSLSTIVAGMTVALAAIAAVALVVAGVGIMNVMLISVTERRAEIGLLKALGAGRVQILATFLVESVLLAVAGGAVGLGVGWGALRAVVHLYPSFPAAPPAWAVVAAVLLSLAVGVGFGVWPARRATRLDPVAALARR